VDWVIKKEKIFDSYDILKKMLSGNAICCEDYIEIFDPPYAVKLVKKERRVTFSENGKSIAILDDRGLKILTENDVVKIIEGWCIALTSLGFKRYSLKIKKQDIKKK